MFLVQASERHCVAHECASVLPRTVDEDGGPVGGSECGVKRRAVYVEHPVFCEEVFRVLPLARRCNARNNGKREELITYDSG